MQWRMEATYANWRIHTNRSQSVEIGAIIGADGHVLWGASEAMH